VSRELQDHLEAALRAQPNTRIQFRDPIAQHGEAIAAVTPWLADRDLCRFAARVIWKAGELGHKDEAVRVLLEAYRDPTVAIDRDDLAFHLRKLGHDPTPATRTARPRDPYAVSSIPAKAGKGWPGFQPHEFGHVEGTAWRSRDGEVSLVPLLLRPLRHIHPRFESWAIYHSPEVHMAVKDRYHDQDDWRQGWRASKLVVYAHGETPDDRDRPDVVTAGYYIEKGGSPEEPWAVDDRWDWPFFLESLRDGHVQIELGSAMARHELRLGDYVGGNRFGPGRATVGFVGSLEDGRLVLRSGSSELAVGWDGLVDALEDLPTDKWHDFHIWRSWPASDAIAAGPSFAREAMSPVLADLARVYLDILHRTPRSIHR
jgi:hypothetical protein